MMLENWFLIVLLSLIAALCFCHRRRLRTSLKQKNSHISVVDYGKIFPPSRRHVLLEILGEHSVEKVPVDLLQKHPLPTSRSCDLYHDGAKYTPTGISMAEIKSIGDFPPYDVLSGVPLPQAYDIFDATKALPRPYRPFRWAYHQTMCKSNSKLHPYNT